MRSIRVITFHVVAEIPAFVLMTLAHADPLKPTLMFVVRARVIFFIRAPLLKSNTVEKSVQKVLSLIVVKPTEVQAVGASWHMINGSPLKAPPLSVYQPRLSINA